MTENEHFLVKHIQCDEKNVIYEELHKNNSSLKSTLNVLHDVKQLKEDIIYSDAT